MRPGKGVWATTLGVLGLWLTLLPTAKAQAPSGAVTWLPLDTTLTPSRRTGCENADAVANRSSMAVRDVAASRRAWRDAQDALLEGDRPRARRFLLEAVAKDSLDLRALSDLGAVQELLADTTAARRATCAVLDAAATPLPLRTEANVRLERLMPTAVRQSHQTATRRFAEGRRYAGVAQWRLAISAFDDVVRLAPSAPEGWRNRGITRAHQGDWTAARSDLERHLQLAPPAADRVLLARALESLRRPRYSAATALGAAVVPGGAQWYTGRPALGALALAGAIGSGVLATRQRTELRQIDFVDPNGRPAPYTERYRTTPYRSAGIVAGAAVLAVAALEGVWFAQRSSKLPPLTVVRRSMRQGQAGLGVEVPVGGLGRR